ncbi:MAG: Tetratricopeptide 2 repeat-containing protein [Chloroflexi bacterium]|nr:Tetratricopeptide 2 repeat-containing protein [Chloroflexota bacterium]
MPNITKQQEDTYRLVLLNADIAAQTNQGERALKLLGSLEVMDLSPSLQAGYFAIAGEACYWLGQYEKARINLETALQLYRHPEGDVATPLRIAQLRNFLAGSYYGQNQHQKALDLHLLCLQGVLDGYITEPRYILKLYNNLGIENFLLGHLTTALQYYQEALKVAEEVDDECDRGAIFWGMGLTYRLLEDYNQAHKALQKGLKHYKKAGAWERMPGIKNTLGWVLISMGEYDQAEKILKSGLGEAIKKTKNIHDQALLNSNLGFLYQKRGSGEVAENYILTGLALAHQTGNKQTLGLVQAQLADVRLARGSAIEEVCPLFEDALASLRQTDSFEFTRRVYKLYADALKKAGLFKEAFDVLNQTFANLKRI